MIATRLYWVLWNFVPNLTNFRPPLSSMSTDFGIFKNIIWSIFFDDYSLLGCDTALLHTLVHRCQCLCLLLFNPEDEDIRFLQNVAIYKWRYMVSHNNSVSFEVLCFHSGADEDSALLKFTLCRLVNSCRCLKEHNASIFRVKQLKKIYSLYHGSISFVLYIYEMVYNIGTSNAYCKFIYSVLQDACETLLKRLERFKAANPKGKWAEWVKAAYCDRVSLSATGFYRWGKLFTLRFKRAFKFRYCLEFFRSF